MMIAQSNRNSRPIRPTMLFTVEAQQLLNVGRVRQAIEVCKRGLVYFPSHVTGYLLLAQAYHDLGQGDRAVNVLRDGYRRTGAIQIERLRALFAGETVEREASLTIPEIGTSDAGLPSNGVEMPEMADPSAAADIVEAVPGAPAEAGAVTEQLEAPESDTDSDMMMEPVEAPESDEASPSISPERVEMEDAGEEIRGEEIVAPAVMETAGDSAGQEVIAGRPEAVAVEARTGEATPEMAETDLHPLAEDTPVAEEGAEEVASDMPAADGGDEVIGEESIIDEGVGDGSVADENIGDEPMGDEGAGDVVVDDHPGQYKVESISSPEPAVPAIDGAHVSTESSFDGDIEAGESAPGVIPATMIPSLTIQPAIEVVLDQDSGVQTQPMMAADEGTSDVPVTSAPLPDAESPGGEPPVIEPPVIDPPVIEPPTIDEPPTAGTSEPLHVAIPENAPEIAAQEDHPATGELAAGQDRGVALPPRPALSIVNGGREPVHARDARRGHLSPGVLIGSEATLERDRSQSLALHTGRHVSRLRSSNLRLIPGLEFAPLRQEEQVRRQPIAPLINEPMPELKRQSRKEKEKAHVPESIPLPGESGSSAPVQVPAESVPAMALPALAAPPIPSTAAAAPAAPERPAPVRRREPVSFVQEIARRHPEPAEERSLSSREALAGSPADEKRFEGLTPLEELARRLEKARIPVVEEPPSRDSSRKGFDSTIVSETLADILLAQGAYQEALKAFRTLARTRADRSAYFQEKIRQIEQTIAEAGSGKA